MSQDQTQTLPQARPGDPLPQIILPDPRGDGINLGHQNRAGRWQVLVFLDPTEVSARLDAVRAARERLNKLQALCYIIALGTPGPNLQGADMFDESGKAATLLKGNAGAGVAVVAPDGTLAACFGDLELDLALMHCEARASAQSASQMKSFAPVLMIDNLLEPQFCTRIIKHWQNNPKIAGRVASSAQGNDQEVASIKQRQDVVIHDGALFEEIKQTIARRVLPQIVRAYQMQIASMEVLRIGEYNADTKGSFGRHRDNSTPYTAHRRLALTINLNTGEYDGGEVRFPEFGPGLYKPPLGGGVVFSAALLHEALPVTRGKRYGMFTFFTDAAGLEQEKAMHERMKAERENKG